MDGPPRHKGHKEFLCVLSGLVGKLFLLRAKSSSSIYSYFLQAVMCGELPGLIERKSFSFVFLSKEKMDKKYDADYFTNKKKFTKISKPLNTFISIRNTVE